MCYFAPTIVSSSYFFSLQTDMEKMEANQEKLLSQVTSLRQRVKTMSAQNERLELMMKRLLKESGVHDFDADEYHDEDPLAIT